MSVSTAMLEEGTMKPSFLRGLRDSKLKSGVDIFVNSRAGLGTTIYQLTCI